LNTLDTVCFDVSKMLIASFGLMVSVLIHLRNLIKN